MTSSLPYGMPAQQESVEVRALDAAHCVAIWGRTLIQIWRGTATSKAVTEMNGVALELVQREGRAATSLFVAEATLPPAGAKPLSGFVERLRREMGSGQPSDLDVPAPKVDLDHVLYAIQSPVDGEHRFDEHGSPGLSRLRGDSNRLGDRERQGQPCGRLPDRHARYSAMPSK
jgi:hypothetical protein